MDSLKLLSKAGLCLLAVSASLFATQTENNGLHIVPTKGAVVIDGELKDWDLSGEIFMCYDIESLADVYSAHVASMYDAENLYLSIHFKDAVPMGNIHDPRYQANRGWAGDAVQLRIKTDRISHVTAWYYGAKKESAFQIAYGKSLTEPFDGGDIQLYQTDGSKLQQGVEMAFKADADGKGYVQEMKIPWKLLTQDKKFQPGDRFNMGVELLWGETDWPSHRYADNMADGVTSREFFFGAIKSWGEAILEPKGNLTLPEPRYVAALRQSQQGGAANGPVEIKYSLPKDAKVSLAIEDPSGKRIRNLIPALPRKAGKNTEKWDGLDDEGKPVPPGDYTFKGIYHDGIRLNYALSFANPGNPSWGTSDRRGAFYGDHTAPQAVASAGDYVGLACPMGEGGQHLIATDLEGQRQWGMNNREAFDGGRISLATDGKILWVANEGKRALVYRVDLATGQYAPWNITETDKDGNAFKPVDLSVSEQPGIASDHTKELKANLVAMAQKTGVLAIALQRENLVKLLDPETGAVQSSIQVEAPQSVVFDSAGHLLVLSKGRIFTVESGKLTPFSQQVYPDGYGLAAAGDGLVFVSVRGADQNVKVLSKTGKFLREIGVKGGRPNNGPFIREAMRMPAGIAIDSRNRLWVTEETINPKRTSVWDVTTGKLLKDLSGTTSYAGAGAINPYDPTMAFADDTVYRIDWTKGTYEPIYSLGKRDDPNDIFPPSVHNIVSRVIMKDGRLYVYTTETAAGADEVRVTLWDGKMWRTVAQMGVVRETQDTWGATLKYRHPFFKGKNGKFFNWTDANGDGLVQEAELNFGDVLVDGKPVKFSHYYWGYLPDDEGTISRGVVESSNLVQFPVTGYNQVGAPVYDLNKTRIIRAQAGATGSEGQITGGVNGNIYVNQNPLTTLDRNGKVLGTYPSTNVSVHGSHAAMAAAPGYIIGPSAFLGLAQIGDKNKGEAGEVFALNGNLGENYLFTEDALFVQSIFKDVRGFFETPSQAVRGMPLDANTAGGESFGGNFIRTKEGKVYLVNGGTDARVIELTGLDSIRRFNGKFTYSPKEFVKAQVLLTDKTAAAQEQRVYTVAKGTPVLTGKPDGWPDLLNDSKPVLEVQESANQRYARVQARYDDQNLYLGYRVFAPRSAMKNVGQDDRLLFKSGDAVDLMIGPDTADAAGKLRLLLSFKGTTPVAVLNQQLAPGAAASEKFDFSSPWRTITFDRVVKVSDVQLTSAPINGGYFVEAIIPWSVLGITPKSGLKLKADVGVLFGDGGTQTVSRKYWSNKATGLVNDVPGEAALTPALWGTFILE